MRPSLGGFRVGPCYLASTQSRLVATVYLVSKANAFGSGFDPRYAWGLFPRWCLRVSGLLPRVSVEMVWLKPLVQQTRNQ